MIGYKIYKINMANNKIVTLDNLTTYNNKIQDKITAIDNVIAILDIEGNGNSYLANDGSYKAIEIPSLDGYAKITDIPSIKLNNSIITPSSGVVDLGYVNKELVTFTESSISLSPNVYYRNTNTNLTSLTITLSSETNIGVLNEYLIEFTTSAGGTTIMLPSSIKWANGEKPQFNINTTYQISIVNNLGVCTKFV